MLRTSILTSLCLAATGCLLLGDDGSSATGGLLETSEDSYVAEVVTDGRERVVVDIPYQTGNHTGLPVYLIGCRRPNPPILEKRAGRDWVTVYAPIVTLCLSPPFEIAPGESRFDTLHVVGFRPGQAAGPTFDGEVAGTYRLRREIFRDLTDEDPPIGRTMLPLSQRVSNSFEIR